jgi:hypothetical protein
MKETNNLNHVWWAWHKTGRELKQELRRCGGYTNFKEREGPRPGLLVNFLTHGHPMPAVSADKLTYHSWQLSDCGIRARMNDTSFDIESSPLINAGT